MSEREQIQNNIVAFLEQHINAFDAPYGVLTGLNPMKRGGKVRTITFGVARYLDATINILSPNNIIVNGQGGLAYKIKGNYKSESEVLTALQTLI